MTPPVGDGMRRKSGCVMRDADHDGSSIGEQIVDAVRDGDAGGVGAEVVVVDTASREIPTGAWILKVAHQFPLFGVDTDDRQAAALKLIAKIAEVEELIVAIGTLVAGQLLVIDAQGIAHLMEETGHRVGADNDAEVAQRHGNLVGRTARPLQAGDGVASGVVFEQELDQCEDVGGFFSTDLRPPPERRVRPVATF